jgi:aromatic ring-cleaving dioxygenase
MKADKQKQLIIEQLRKTPIVQVVAEKVGIHRSTIYRWKTSDAEFSEAVDEAMEQSIGLVNDLAESQLISAIRDKNITAIIYWLKNHHKAYETRIKVTGSLNHSVNRLDDEQNELVMKALTKAGLLIDEEHTNDDTTDQHLIK